MEAKNKLGQDLDDMLTPVYQYFKGSFTDQIAAFGQECDRILDCYIIVGKLNVSGEECFSVNSMIGRYADLQNVIIREMNNEEDTRVVIMNAVAKFLEENCGFDLYGRLEDHLKELEAEN